MRSPAPFVALLLLARLAAAQVAPEDSARFADGLYARGLYDLAAREYRAVLKTAPPSVDRGALYFRLGECFRHLKQLDAAGDAYQVSFTTYTNSPQRFRAWYRYADVFVEGGRYDAAIGQLQALVAAGPPPEVGAAALYRLGFAQAKSARDAEAEQAFRRVLRQLPESSYAALSALALGELLDKKSGWNKEAQELYEQAAAKAESPEVAAEALVQLADKAFAARDYKTSADAFARLLKRFPENERTVASRLRAAWAFHNAGHFKEALALFAVQEKEGSADADWLYLAANSRRRLGEDASAREAYDRLLASHPESPLASAAAYECALLAAKAGDHRAVLALAPKVKPDKETEPQLLWMKAEAHEGLKEPDAALAAYRALREKYPGHELSPAAELRAARVLQERGELAAASDLYRAAAAAHPASGVAPEALLGSAFCRASLKQYEEALKDWNRVVQDYPDFKDMDQALFGRAQAEIELGRDADAASSLEMLIKAHAKSSYVSEAHYLMGVLLEKAERLDQVEAHYRASLENKPPPRIAGKVRFRLAAALQREGKNDEAAVLLQTLMSAPPDAGMPPSLVEWLARWNLEKNRWPEAEAAGARLAETPEAAWRPIGWYLVGRAREGGGKAAEAMAAYQKAMDGAAPSRESADAALRLGQLALAGQDAALAARSFTAAADLARGDDLIDVRAKSYFGLGRAAEAQNKWDDASRYYMSVGLLFDDPGLTPESLFRAAEALGKLGRKAEREGAVRELIERYPDSPWSAKAREPGTT
jgi:TolA-binding protein